VSDRDAWCTPPWLTALLPEVDLDPCSNERSTVRARKTYQLDRGEDGLALPWSGSIWCNPPYSDVLPWAEKAAATVGYPPAPACGFLVNVDSSTTWWRTLTSFLPYIFLFDRRIQFVPPPGITPSTNRKPQALICNAPFLFGCHAELRNRGSLWALEAA
jgi:hypothetical protein